MTLDDAIIHAEEVANSKCDKCGAEHKQLAEWLKDYKRLLEQEPENIITHIEAVQDNLNRMVNGLDDDTDYYDATYHLELIKEKVEQEPRTDRIEYGTDGNPYKLSISNGKEYEQEPCEDCISRKAVLKLFATHNGKYLYEAIRDMPSVEQEPKTGHWITCDVLQEVKCSECRVCFRRITNYCPNCGAKMEVEYEG